MTDYAGAMDVMDAMIARRERGYVCAVAVHAVMVSQERPRDARGRARLHAHACPTACRSCGPRTCSARTSDRVYGPELMRRYNERCAEQGHRVWLYGGRDQGSLVQLALRCAKTTPASTSSAATRRRSARSPPRRRTRSWSRSTRQPDVLWVGIGVPKQEKWMARMRERLDVPVMCAVGAAFDFHAGRISQAPSWMQERGLEWTYRIAQEPRRLLPRYLYFNPRFLLAFARQYLRERAWKSRSS